MRAVPYGGGVAIFLAALAPVAIGVLAAGLVVATGWGRGWLPEGIGDHLEGMVRSDTLRNLAAVWVGGFVLLLVGLHDDRRGLGPWPKLGVPSSMGSTNGTSTRARPLNPRRSSTTTPASSPSMD